MKVDFTLLAYSVVISINIENYYLNLCFKKFIQFNKKQKIKCF